MTDGRPAEFEIHRVALMGSLRKYLMLCCSFTSTADAQVRMAVCTRCLWSLFPSCLHRPDQWAMLVVANAGWRLSGSDRRWSGAASREGKKVALSQAPVEISSSSRYISESISDEREKKGNEGSYSLTKEGFREPVESEAAGAWEVGKPSQTKN